jgi:hypothetical protein
VKKEGGIIVKTVKIVKIVKIVTVRAGTGRRP